MASNNPGVSRHTTLLRHPAIPAGVVRMIVCALMAIPGVIATAPLTSCVPSFKLNGSALNYDVYRTISISDFPIRAALVYPPLETEFENRLLNTVTRQTRLQEVDGNADLEMTGEITGYALTPQAVGENAYATETRLTITVRVKYTDNINPANNVDQTFSAYRQFSADLLLIDVQDDLCREISEELVDLIFNATLGNW